MCTLGRVEAGGSEQAVIIASASATAGRVANTATVSGNQLDSNPANNRASATVTVPPPPAHPIPATQKRFNLVISKHASSTFLAIGEPVTYTIHVTNHGPDAAPRVGVVDTLDAPATIEKVKSTAGSCTTRMPLRCSLGTIHPGTTATITVIAKLLRAGCGQVNSASVTAVGIDEDFDRIIDHVAVCVTALRLGFTKTVSRFEIEAGGRLTYVIRVTNRSRYAADNLSICDQLPTALQYLSSKPAVRDANGRICWSLATLHPGQSHRYRITVRAASGITDVVRIVNHATLHATDLVAEHANALVLVVPRPTGPCATPASRYLAHPAC
jgi:uncharacterized repeat protein (TIGR01451 family)